MNVKNRSHTITADVEVPKGGANGVILAQAGRFGGWSLYVKDGKPTYTYNFVGLNRYTVAAKQALPPGKSTIRFEFVYDGGGVGKGGTGTIFVNDKKVATGRIDQTQCCAFSADEGADVGEDEGTPVTEAFYHLLSFNKMFDQKKYGCVACAPLGAGRTSLGCSSMGSAGSLDVSTLPPYRSCPLPRRACRWRGR